jgi:hypothetical protein
VRFPHRLASGRHLDRRTATQAGTTFTIRTVEHVVNVYRGIKLDPDGDSDGTTITFKKK